MEVTVVSFGFKYGVPDAATMVWDVRFLPNPYWVDEMRPLTGLDPAVANYVVESQEGKEFIQLVEPLLNFLVQKNIATSKNELTLAVGCTGGRHRSVAVAERLKHLLSGLPIDLKVCHRDIELESQADGLQ